MDGCQNRYGSKKTGMNLFSSPEDGKSPATCAGGGRHQVSGQAAGRSGSGRAGNQPGPGRDPARGPRSRAWSGPGGGFRARGTPPRPSGRQNRGRCGLEHGNRSQHHQTAVRRFGIHLEGAGVGSLPARGRSAVPGRRRGLDGRPADRRPMDLPADALPCPGPDRLGIRPVLPSCPSRQDRWSPHTQAEKGMGLQSIPGDMRAVRTLV